MEGNSLVKKKKKREKKKRRKKPCLLITQFGASMTIRVRARMDNIVDN